MIARYDVVVVLGAQIGRDEQGRMGLAFHTEMRARAAGVAWRYRLTKRFIVSGGYNVGVRYTLDLKIPVFGTEKSDRRPSFDFDVKERTRFYRSEASVIAAFLRRHYTLPPEVLILEEDSDTTEANAKEVKTILSRLGGSVSVGLLTSLYHMPRASGLFQTMGVTVHPVCAEELLAKDTDRNWIEVVGQYYQSPRGQRQWDHQVIGKIMQSIRTEGLQEHLVGSMARLYS